MQRQFFQYEDAQVSYLRYGSGDSLLIALHGFGDRATIFEALEGGLGKHFTVCALDLPFHGQTKWASDTFSDRDLLNLILRIAELENRQRFSLLGYSFGGRIVQVLLEDLLPYLERLFLVAPDGLQTKRMFNVTRTPLWARLLLKRLLESPIWFFRLLHWAYKRGRISKFVHDFAYNHTKTPERRQRLLGTWVSMRYFINYPRKVKALLKKTNLPVDLYYGSRDEVIPIAGGEWLAADLPTAHLHCLNEGHRLIDQELNDLLKRQLTTSNEAGAVSADA